MINHLVHLIDDHLDEGELEELHRIALAFIRHHVDADDDRPVASSTRSERRVRTVAVPREPSRRISSRAVNRNGRRLRTITNGVPEELEEDVEDGDDDMSFSSRFSRM